VAFEGEGAEAVGEEEEDLGGLRLMRGELLKIQDGVGVERAAEVGAAEVSAAEFGDGSVGREHGVDAGVERVALEAAGVEAGEEELSVKRGVDGVSGEGVVELEAEVLANRDGRPGGAQRDAGRGGGRRGERCGGGCGAAGWRGVRHQMPSVDGGGARRG
jgi:hypothetical protein